MSTVEDSAFRRGVVPCNGVSGRLRRAVTLFIGYCGPFAIWTSPCTQLAARLSRPYLFLEKAGVLFLTLRFFPRLLFPKHRLLGFRPQVVVGGSLPPLEAAYSSTMTARTFCLFKTSRQRSPSIFAHTRWGCGSLIISSMSEGVQICSFKFDMMEAILSFSQLLPDTQLWTWPANKRSSIVAGEDRALGHGRDIAAPNVLHVRP